MKIRVFDTPREAGIYVAALAEQVIESKNHPVLGLATGTTPIPFYQSVVQLHQCGLRLSDTITINLDEYVGLPASHPHSYHYFMQEQLFSKTDIKPGNIFIPQGDAKNLDEECERYDEIIQTHPIDLQILGIGLNGHIGFNEPDDLLLSKTHIVNLRDKTIASNARFFDKTADVPKQAITMGVQAILQAERIVFMAFGRTKAAIVAEAVKENVRTEVPASVLQLHRNVTMVLDRECACALPELNGRCENG